MGKIITYLTFNGNCKEAMTFYKNCLGGELHLQTVGESPLSDKLPLEMKNYILQAVLKNQNFSLMGTDMVEGNGLSKGNAVSMFISCKNESEMRRFFLKLSNKGQITHEVAPTYWGALFGSLVDQFGHHWLLQCPNLP